MKEIHSDSWGIEAIDRVTGGLPENLISVVETSDYISGHIVLGAYMNEGLKRGEKCVFVTFESPETFLRNFSDFNYNFEKFILSEHLIFLNYQPNIAYEAGLTSQYDEIFEEIVQLCGGDMPHRIAIDQIDTLINLNNPVSMNFSAQKLCLAVSSERLEKTTVLGQFVNYQDSGHSSLSIALQKTVFGYFQLRQSDPLIASKYEFLIKKLPWFRHHRKPLELELDIGNGFVHDRSANVA